VARKEEVALTALKERLAICQAFVLYRPLRTEVDANTLFPIPEGARTYRIEPRASLDPREEALRAMEVCKDLPTVVLVPGRRFDALGTRHGQGGGWYDRFLARVPDSWLRVGFCYSDQLSVTPLVRNVWDQPMDYVVVLSRETGDVLVRSSGRLGA